MRDDGRSKRKKKKNVDPDRHFQSGLAPSLVLPIPQPLMLSVAPEAPRMLCSLAECGELPGFGTFLECGRRDHAITSFPSPFLPSSPPFLWEKPAFRGFLGLSCLSVLVFTGFLP